MRRYKSTYGKKNYYRNWTKNIERSLSEERLYCFKEEEEKEEKYIA